MGEQSIILPADSVGKAIHTRERTVTGPGVVQEQYVIPRPARVDTGCYLANLGTPMTVLASAHAATAGFAILINRSAAQMVAVEYVDFQQQIFSTLVCPTSPRIGLERCTFTGTPSGTQVFPAKRIRTAQNGEPADATAIGEIRTVLTGLTVANNELAFGFMTQIVMVTVSANVTPVPLNLQTFGPFSTEDSPLLLANGEGLLIRQMDAGTTSDTRRFTMNIRWREYTVP